MIEGFFGLIFQILSYVWWLLAFAILAPLWKSTWLFWRQALYKNRISWTMFELRIPREVRKSARAMEQVLTAMHSLRNSPGNPQEWYWDGEVTKWFCLEIVSFGGEVHFYMRVPSNLKNLVQAPLFSYYPDVEVEEVEDYVSRFPASMDDAAAQGYDLWGTEMVLDKDKPYPIKTYMDFEDAVEEKSFDPMAVFLEVLGKLKKEEIVGIQILIAPMDMRQWQHEGEELVEELKEKNKKDSHGEDAISAITKFTPRTPGETDVLEKVERNMAKPAFETLIRFIYLSPKSGFADSFPRRGLTGAFNQYAALNMNRLRPNFIMSTRTLFWRFPYLFSKTRNEYKKARMLYNYRHRKLPWHTTMGKLVTSFPLNWNFASKEFPLNVEAVATLFHPPSFTVVTAPHIRRVESKKMGPQAGLPIFGEEGELERFQ